MNIPRRHKYTTKQKQAIAKQISLALDRKFARKGGKKRLAEIVGVTPAAISHWKKGVKTPTIHHLVRLAPALDTPVHVLCGLPGNRRSDDDDLFFNVVMDLSIVGAMFERRGKMEPRAEQVFDQIIGIVDAFAAKAESPVI